MDYQVLANILILKLKYNKNAILITDVRFKVPKFGVLVGINAQSTKCKCINCQWNTKLRCFKSL